MMSKVAKGVRNPHAALRYIKRRLQYAYLCLIHDSTESVEFYKELQDKKIRDGEAYPRGKGIGEAQIEFLRRSGLQPDDDLLDIGCGNLRGGKYMIHHLQDGSYTGMDISEEAIAAARENSKSWDTDTTSVTLLINDDLKFDEFEDDAFDWVFANSVLTHLPETNIRECFENLGRVLRDDGTASLSYRHTDGVTTIKTNTTMMSNVYGYPFETLASWASEYGLRAEQDAYEEHPRDDMRMVILCSDSAV